MNPVIVSLFMDNINSKTVELQKKVVQKFNRSRVPHIQVQSAMPHGISMDYFMSLCGCVLPTFEGHKIEKQYDFDAVFFLDIDAIPLNDRAIDTYLAYAYEEHLAGNAQRSNHIDNNQHMFAAPSAVAISKQTYELIGCPSAFENLRADVGEEWTYKARENKVPVDLAMPICYNEPPFRYDWEPKNSPPYWDLADGYPKYGSGTTFGDKIGELFYHQFQIRIPGVEDKFWKKCESILGD